ncbi:PAS domain-containing protein [Natronoarchaeum sp. GCM10025703]|uniref:PAS domain-containing protein n=1 Tax=Natronoarchaeum sp. GCM10025703 TaxID=3252685 RepID=UPI0036182CF5
MLEQVERALRQAVDGVATRHVDASGAISRPTETDCIVIPDSSEVDGLEHVRAVRERVDSAAVVVVAIDASDGFARDAKAAGADDVICIPSDESADELFPGAVAERIRHAADRTDPFADDAALLDDLLDNIPHRVFIKNEYGRFAAVSGAKANHYGLTREDVVGLSDFELNPEMGAELREQEVEIMETGEPVVNEVDGYVDDDGRNRWVSTTKAPRRDETGDVVGIVGSTRDVTAQRRHEEMLNALHTASRDLVAAESSTEIVDVATNIAEDVPDMPTVVVAVAEDEGLTFEAACELDCDCYGQCEPTLETSYETEVPIAVLEDGDRRRYDAVSEDSTPTCVAFPLGDHGALGVVDMDDLLTDSALELRRCLRRTSGPHSTAPPGKNGSRARTSAWRSSPESSRTISGTRCRSRRATSN